MDFTLKASSPSTGRNQRKGDLAEGQRKLWSAPRLTSEKVKRTAHGSKNGNDGFGNKS